MLLLLKILSVDTRWYTGVPRCRSFQKLLSGDVLLFSQKKLAQVLDNFMAVCGLDVCRQFPACLWFVASLVMLMVMFLFTVGQGFVIVRNYL